MNSHALLNPESMDVVILCGGQGTRLKKVISDRPKPMAEINHRPFLDILIDYIAKQGFKRFILCTGYRGDVIRKYYEKINVQKTFIFSEEKVSLGTGGAIKNAEILIQSSVFLAMNGDSFCKLNMHNFLAFHASKKAFACIALTKKRSADCGAVQINDDYRLISFQEKRQAEKEGLVSAGFYLFNREMLSLIPAHRSYSLEYELFPALVHTKDVYGFPANQELIDIGTPERYEFAQKVFTNITYLNHEAQNG